MSDETQTPVPEVNEDDRNVLRRIADRMSLLAVRKAIVAALDDESDPPLDVNVEEAKTRFEEFGGE